ncbi:MAG: M23 family metallopeptidase [Sulfuricurvum sp.]|nr:M23 family metallopeptidase [Sulfuricurvum sp.]
MRRGSALVKSILIIISAILLLQGQDGLPYCTLAQPLEQNARKMRQLDVEALNTSEKKIIERFCSGVKETLSMGEALSKFPKPQPELLTTYLKELRELTSQEEVIYQLYRASLSDAIQTEDNKRFEHLTSIGLEPLHQPRIRADAIAYYQKNFPTHSIKSLDLLCNEQVLEKKSIQFVLEQEQAYEEHLRILKRSEAQQIRKTAKMGSRNSVMITAETTSSGAIDFEAENLNPYRVTLTLDFESILNLKTSIHLPLSIELRGYSKKKILALDRIDSTKSVNYKSSYGWVRGSPFVKHDDAYVYGLPFAKGSTVRVSQGYNGDTSHKGLSAYAIDFPLPMGTSIYAARDGIIVGVEVSNTFGGPSPEYRPYANYVVIEHDDGTMGNYYHLKQGGTAVKIGDKVTKGQLIAYSGNTGYTTAPHLHFSVSKVDPVSMRRPMNLPVKMQTMMGIVTCPRCGDYYTVQ